MENKKKKKVALLIKGGGIEIVQGIISSKEQKALEEFATVNGVSINDALSTHINELETVGLTTQSWFDCDNLCHYSGAALDASLYVKNLGDSTGNHSAIDYDTSYDLSTLSPIFQEEDDEASLLGDYVVSFVSIDKGNWKKAIIELEEEEIFDIKQFKITYTTIWLPNDTTREVILDWYYKDSIIDDELNNYGDSSNTAVICTLHPPTGKG